ncbi:hypothetical protein VBM87_02110 [Mycoplasma sp. 744]|nr:hypothetical protein [Mycoplasma sp. 744]
MIKNPGNKLFKNEYKSQFEGNKKLYQNYSKNITINISQKRKIMKYNMKKDVGR